MTELIERYNLGYLFNNNNSYNDSYNYNYNNYNSGGQNELSKQFTKSSNNLYNNPNTFSTNINNKDNNKNNNNNLKRILNGIKRYEANDMIDLYLKSRGINKYCNDCYIYTNKYNNVICIVNLCNKVINNSPEEILKKTNKLYKRTNDIVGLQRTYLYYSSN